jgi:hypothetical protein
MFFFLGIVHDYKHAPTILCIFIRLYIYVMISYCPLYGMVIYRNMTVNMCYWYMLNLCSRDSKFRWPHKKLFCVL